MVEGEEEHFAILEARNSETKFKSRSKMKLILFFYRLLLVCLDRVLWIGFQDVVATL